MPHPFLAAAEWIADELAPPTIPPRPFASAEAEREVLFKDENRITWKRFRSTRSLFESVTYEAHQESALALQKGNAAAAILRRGPGPQSRHGGPGPQLAPAHSRLTGEAHHGGFVGSQLSQGFVNSRLWDGNERGHAPCEPQDFEKAHPAVVTSGKSQRVLIQDDRNTRPLLP
jgi:hypothetical protein